MRGRLIERLSVASDKVYGVSRWITRWFQWVGVVAAVVMLAITFVEVVIHKVLSYPILGAYDFVCFTLLLTLTFMVSVTLINDRHLSVTLLVSKFPKRVQAVVESVVSFLAGVVSVLVIGYGIRYGLVFKTSGEYSLTTGLPWYPLYFIMAAGFVPVALLFFTKTVKAILSLRFTAR